MNASFHKGNRQKLFEMLPAGALLLMFAGVEFRKTNDEYYPFYAERNFVYLTGIQSKESVLLAAKDQNGETWERLYILRPDDLAERWTGRRLTMAEAEAASGISDVRYTERLDQDLHVLAAGGRFERLYLDLFRADPLDQERPSHRLAAQAAARYPCLQIHTVHTKIGRLRLIKQACEIEAIRQAEKITKDGILAMMKASKPGMYEFQYKAAFDYALGQHGPQGPAFPPIISAGKNNFCIHYYAYTGCAQDGDMILSDVGGQYDNLMTDVSRAWPCNGHFDQRQKCLYECALATSDHMFSVIRPGMRMDAVDQTIRSFNAERLREAGVLSSAAEIGTYMWHGGAHHVGYDVHDAVEKPRLLAPGMVFCVDVGIYHQQWGIGFRLEDNCLVTEDGCENLSRSIPRTVEDIEAVMRG